ISDPKAPMSEKPRSSATITRMLGRSPAVAGAAPAPAGAAAPRPAPARLAVARQMTATSVRNRGRFLATALPLCLTAVPQDRPCFPPGGRGDTHHGQGGDQCL